MIVLMGDSITFGQHIDPSKTWPRLLDNRVIRIAGVPGDTTRLALERFPRDVQEVEPDAVVIQFGHNDCNRWLSDRGIPRVSAPAFRANLTEMIDRARTFNVWPFLCSITPAWRSIEHTEDCAHYDQIVREVANLNIVPLIDVRLAFNNPNYLLDDGLHLSELGHRAYAEVVDAALNREGIK